MTLAVCTEELQKLYMHHYCRAVGTGGAQGHVPPQYLEQPVVVPLQYCQQIWGITKWVPPQYLAPSYGPDSLRLRFHQKKILSIDNEKKSIDSSLRVF